MATCVIEDALLTSLHCQTTNSMKRTPSFSSFESTNNEFHPRCSFSYHGNSLKIDATLLKNHELTKKRQLSRSNTYNSNIDLTKTIIDNSCSSQAVTTNDTNTETAITTTSTRPKTLFLTSLTTDRKLPPFRTCLSHPSTSANPCIPIDDDSLTSFKFTSLPELLSPPAKRLRPQSLTITPTNLSIPQTVLPTPVTSSSIHFIDSIELADKLKGNFNVTIFDCGSPFRHSENRIHNSILLRVSDKISRKRLKSNPKQHSTIDIKQINESDFLILYDDNTNNNHHRHSINPIESSSEDKHDQLSAGLKCACEEIQRCLTIKYPPIFILKNSFNHFFDLYPNLCESLQSRSSPSSPINHTNDSSSSPPPQTAPILPILLTDNDINNSPMTHIINGLFIGSESNAKNLEELSSEQIRYIVNVTSHVPLYHSDQLNYCHIPADDTQKQNLLDYFDQAYSFINNAIENNEKVLVHCVAGISRSPAIVISFLMRYAHMNMNDAYEFVKRKRSIVSPNLNFMGQLLQYEKKLREQN